MARLWRRRPVGAQMNRAAAAAATSCFIGEFRKFAAVDSVHSSSLQVICRPTRKGEEEGDPLLCPLGFSFGGGGGEKEAQLLCLRRRRAIFMALIVLRGGGGGQSNCWRLLIGSARFAGSGQTANWPQRNANGKRSARRSRCKQTAARIARRRPTFVCLLISGACSQRRAGAGAATSANGRTGEGAGRPGARLSIAALRFELHDSYGGGGCSGRCK